MKLNFDDTTINISSNGNVFTLLWDDRKIQAEVLHSGNGKFDLLIEGKRVTAYVSSDNTKRWVTIDGARRGSHAGHHAAGELTAPMPGQVRAVNVSEGDAVTKGQTLMVLEAMKMEIRIHAFQDGTVKKLFVQPGQTVEREQVLVEIAEN
jgi:biotin carboxyl carrier protein